MGVQTGGRQAAPGGCTPLCLPQSRYELWPPGQKYNKIKGKGSTETLKRESQPVKTQDPDEGKGDTMDRSQVVNAKGDLCYEDLELCSQGRILRI